MNTPETQRPDGLQAPAPSCQPRFALRCTGVLPALHGKPTATVTLASYTPYGRLDVEVTDPDAILMFEVGKEYYVNISPVPA